MLVLRFGFSESMFAEANSSLATQAAFIGLPCIGLCFWPLRITTSDKILLILSLVVLEAGTRHLKEKAREIFKIWINIVFFIGPVIITSYLRHEFVSLLGAVLFVIAGIVITPARHKYIAGVRCENWFHYLIAIAAIMIAKGL